MTPTLSIVLPTSRVGGLDLVFDSLAKQTRLDFELILVDSIKRYRADAVAAEAAKLPFPVRHIEPFPGEFEFPYTQHCRALNTGFAHARGKLVLVSADYAWFAPGVVECHAALHADNEGVAILGPYVHLVCPERTKLPAKYGHDGVSDLSGTLTPYSEAADRYVADLESGRLNDCMISIFDKRLTMKDLADIDCELDMRERKAEHGWSHQKNESYPLDVVLDLNGVNEQLDGSWGRQDSEFAERLVRYGLHWAAMKDPDQTAGTWIVNVRHLLYARKYVRPPVDNKRFVGAGYVRANRDKDYRHIRRELLKEIP